jgi:hypothetical protein
MDVDTPDPDVVSDVVERRLGLDWCLVHREPLAICHCARTSHNWSATNALRRYTSLMLKGHTHPFHEAGGPLAGAKEGPAALQQAIEASTIERVPIESLIATQPITPAHIGAMLRGKAPEPRTGNSALESPEHPTVIRVGKQHVLADGHHRAVAEWSKGAAHLKARVVSGVTPTFDNGDELTVRPEV